MDVGGPIYRVLRDEVRAGRPVAVCTVVAVREGGAETPLGAKLLVRPGHVPLGSFGDAELDRVVARDAEAVLALGRSEERSVGRRGEHGAHDVTYFVESHAPPPHLVLVGAADVTRALVRLGRLLGYRTTVCDPRATFTTAARFPEAHEVVVDWPDRYLTSAALDERSVVCVLTHDERIDVPALVAALRSPAGYVGAMGSRRTTSDRIRRLLEAGVDQGDVDRISAPIGLDLGSTTPEETAVSILAEVIARRNQRAGAPLAGGDGPLHGPSPS